MQDLVAARHQMTTQQVRAWSALNDERLAVFDRLPREIFVPDSQRALAYADAAVPLPCGQHMLRPSVVGRIVQAVDPRPGERVLEIGTGSGYVSAALALLAGSVHSLEIHEELAHQARSNLRAAGIGNVQVEVADAFEISTEPVYDIVVITGSMPLYDNRFEALLKGGGRLFVVTGEPPIMEALLVHNHGTGQRSALGLFETVSDPLIHAPRVDPFEF